MAVAGTVVQMVEPVFSPGTSGLLGERGDLEETLLGILLLLVLLACLRSRLLFTQNKVAVPTRMRKGA